MSVENVEKFYEDLAKDESVREKAAKFVTSEEGKKMAAETVAAFAASSGYDISVSDVEEYSRSRASDIAESDTALYDWDQCFCIAGGGGHNRTEGYSCACIAGGGGKKDRDGYYLYCLVFGNV